FRVACERAALRVADGMPIIWGTRLLGRPLRARVAGADLVPALCRLAAGRGHTVFFLGGKPGVADMAARRLEARFPGLRAAGTQVRAPGWMQRAGLEWLWRLALEPERLWKRYLVRDAAFVGIFLTEWWRERIKTPGR